MDFFRDTFGLGMPDVIPSSGLSFGATYQAIYDSFPGGAPPDSQALAQNTMVESLVSSGVWPKLDAFLLYANNNEANAVYDWIRLLNITNVHSTLFTANEGFTGDGTNDYLNILYDGSTDAVNYALNSASFGFYSRLDKDEGSIDCGAQIGADIAYIITKSAGNVRPRVNTNGGGTAVITDTLGFICANRVINTHQEAYLNKVRVANIAQGSVAIPAGDFYMLGVNLNGALSNPSTRQLSMGFVGGGLTQTDVNNFVDAIETYMDFLGKGVVS